MADRASREEIIMATATAVESGGGQPRRRARRFGRLAGLLAAGAVGAGALLFAGSTGAQANYPGPPPGLEEEQREGVAPAGAYEDAPAGCPTSVPSGTVRTAIPFKEICEKAVRTAPTPEAAAAIRYAFSKLGSPYSQSLRYSISPPIFDCSSFIARAYDAANAPIYRNGQTLSWFRNDYTLSWTGAYMPANYSGSNVIRLGSKNELQPGDILIQFDGSTPANSAGNGGHAQMWLGDGLVIQSGGDHPQSLVNVSPHNNWFSNEWYFRYTSTPQISPIFHKWMALGASTGFAGSALDATTNIGNGYLMRRYQGAWIYWSQPTGANAVYGRALLKYASMGAHTSVLGPPVTDQANSAVAGTQVNRFVGGAIYSSVATTNEVFGGIWQRYAAMGAERSGLSVPVGREEAGPVPGSVQQRFAAGTMYYSGPTGAQPVTGAIDARYRTAGVAANLGLPRQGVLSTASSGGAGQLFEKGAIYSSGATGTYEVYGGIFLKYVSLGADSSPLGLPTSVEKAGPVPGSRMQTFQGGTIFWSAAYGTHEVVGVMRTAYDKAGGSVMGVPTGPQRAVPGGYLQVFSSEVLVTSGSNWYSVRDGMWQRYAALGADRSPLGLPVGSERAGRASGTRVQDFQYGQLYWSAPTGAQEIYGAIGVTYRQLGAEASALGMPTTGETAGPLPGSRMNRFTKGAVIWSPSTGARAVVGAMSTSYFDQSLFNYIGLPSSAEAAGGVAGSKVQSFQRGKMYYSAATGAHAVWGAILVRYQSMGAERSAAGLPTSSEISGGPAGTRMNTFAKGTIYWSARTGAQDVLGAIYTRYKAISGPKSVFGMPRSSAVSVGGNMVQTFDGGAMYWSSSAGVREVYGEIYRRYLAMGAHNSPLGPPTASEGAGPVAGSRMSQFVGGAIYWSSATGPQDVYGAIGLTYRNAKLAAAIGLPISSERAGSVAGSRVQEFQRGTMYWSAATGAHEVYGAIRDRYRSLGAERSALGLPTTGEYTTSTGRANDFAKGRISWNSRTGAVTVTTK